MVLYYIVITMFFPFRKCIDSILMKNSSFVAAKQYDDRSYLNEYWPFPFSSRNNNNDHNNDNNDTNNYSM